MLVDTDALIPRLRGHDHCGQGDRGQRKRTKDFVRNRHSKPLD